MDVRELVGERQKVRAALQHLLVQGDSVPPEQKEELGRQYAELFEVDQKMTQDIQTAMQEGGLSGVPATVPAAAPTGARRVRWGVLAVGGVGVLSLIGLLAWQMWVHHDKRKGKKKR